MSAFVARVHVTPKPTVRDPEGTTIHEGLKQLGYDMIQGLRAGKYFEVRIDSGNREAATEAVTRMCRELLANPVIEQFSFELEPA
jgi:phosphoribosylformylglycinamidine synthase